MSIRSLLSVAGFLLYGLTWATSLSAEPLRMLVPAFFGPEPLSQQVRTTLFFEIVKGLQALDAPGKGVWILYGENKIERPTHDAILESTAWPSVRADLAIWGQVHQFDDGVVVQLHFSLTPLLKQRAVRPELWGLSLRNSAGQYEKFELDIPGQFYTFEPMLLTPEAVMKFSDPTRIGLYSLRQGGELRGTVGEVIHFYEIYDDASKISTNNKIGWVRTPPITKQDSEAIAFSKGLVRLLRGDWRGAQQSFNSVLANKNLPQELRIHALLYLGLAKEKGGDAGRREFEMAHRLNPLDRSAVAYLLMSELADISKLQTQGKKGSLKAARQRLRETLDSTRVLFPADDAWLKHIEKYHADMYPKG
jgi:hypothetical protein